MRRIIALLAVFLVPAFAAAQRHQNFAKGFSADKVFEFNDVDHINTFNGSLNVVLPLGQKYQVSGGLAYQFVLTYSGNNWETLDTWDTFTDPNTNETTPVLKNYDYPVGTWEVGARRRSAGLGWRLSFGNISPYEQAAYPWFYRGPDGSEHRFHPRLHHDDLGANPAVTEPNPGFSYTNDGSYLRAHSYSDGGIAVVDVEFPDGTVHQFNASDGEIRHMRDAYGNRVNFSEATSNNGNTITRTISDAFRTQTMTFAKVTTTVPAGTDDPAFFEVLQTLDVAAFNGGRARYRFYYRDSGISVVSRHFASLQDCRVAPGSHVPVL
ncbi:MAG TPA: hypothetical protein VN181_05050, partial [Thermoanaerobaculia bacterium]|nr:hypothetical protein [Thermoanaerobaculia bacterium]